MNNAPEKPDTASAAAPPGDSEIELHPPAEKPEPPEPEGPDPEINLTGAAKDVPAPFRIVLTSRPRYKRLTVWIPPKPSLTRAVALFTRTLVVRELLRECRYRMHLLGRIAFVAALAGLIIALWLDFGATAHLTARQYVWEFGLRVFSVWALVQYAAVTIFSTLRAATLADERRIGALPLLRTTPLEERGCILAQFLSVMTRMLFTLIVALPVLVVSTAFGGFTMTQAVTICAVTIMAAAHATAITQAIAASCNSTGAAAGWSLAVQGVWFLMTWWTGAGILNAGALIRSLVSGSFGGYGHAAAYLLSRGFLVPLYLLKAVNGLSRSAAQPRRHFKRLLTSLDGCVAAFTGGRIERWRARLGTCTGNPVLWRERATSILGHRRHVVWLIMVLFLLFGFVGCSGRRVLIDDTTWTGLVGMPVLTSAVLLVVLAASAFSREHRNRTLSLLALTPIGSRRIVMGKYLFGLRSGLIPLALVFVYCVQLLVLGEQEDLIRFFPALALVALLPLVAAQVLFATAGTRSPARAVVAGVSVLIGAVIALSPGWRRGLWQSIGDFRLPPLESMVYAPATAAALAAAALAGRFRTLGKAPLLFAVVAVPFVAMQRFEAIDPEEAVGLALDEPAVRIGLGAVAGIILVASVLLGRGPIWRWPTLIVGVAGLTALQATLPPEQAGRVFMLALLAAAIQAMRFASPGAANRVVFAVASTFLLVGAMPLVGLSPEVLWEMPRRVTREAVRRSALFFCVTLVAGGGLTVAFLALTTSQLSRLIGRNG